jgi:uncharacterized protein (DUF362 family)
MDRITRREFLKISAGIAVASALPVGMFNSLKAQGSEPVISVARGEVTKLVKAAVDGLGGISTFVRPGQTVCIKPNISFAANTECGATTNPDIARQMVNLCLSAGAAKVIILDHTIADADICVEKSRIEEAIVDAKRVSLLTLTQERQFSETTVLNGQELSTIKIAKAIQKADVLINLPTAKSHSATGVSLGIKNLMGLIWDRGILHQVNLHRAIAELALVIKPDLTVIDATRALTTGGPGGPGKTVILNTVVAGIDPVAVDSYAVGLTPWYGKSFTGSGVKYIVAASEIGLGEIDTGLMSIKETEV